MTPGDSAEIQGNREADEMFVLSHSGALVESLPAAPLGQAPPKVRAWFDAIAAAARPENDGSLAAAHDLARAYRSRAKADNTRAAYRSAVRPEVTNGPEL